MKPWHILIIEDSASDAGLVARHIEQSGHVVVWERVDGPTELGAAIEKRQWDVVLCDYSMPDFSGTEALAIVRAKHADVPFIFVSGTMGEDIAVEAMRAGAQDYVVKGNFKRLVPAIERELKEAEVRRQRRQALEALRESEGRFIRLIEAAPDVIFSLDGDGAVTMLNPAFERLTGWATCECLGRPLMNVVAEEDAATAADYFRRLLEGQRESMLELRLRKKGGGFVVGELSTVAVIKKQTVEGVFGILRDVTLRRSLEERLRASDALLREVGRIAAIGGWELDLKSLGRWPEVPVTWTEEVYQIHGVPPGTEVTLAMALQYYAPEFRAIVEAALKEAIASGKQFEFTIPCKAREREVRWLHHIGRSEQEQGKILGTVQDVTERRKAEDALRISETRYRRLFEEAREGILILNAGTGEIDDANPFLTELIGRTRDEVLKKPVWEVEELKALIPGRETFQRMQQSETLKISDLRLETIQGRVLELEMVSSTYRADGVKFVQCSIWDITERKRAAEVLLRRTEEQDRFIRLSAGRELRMIELKKEVNEMAQIAGRQPPYDLSFLEKGTGS